MRLSRLAHRNLHQRTVLRGSLESALSESLSVLVDTLRCADLDAVRAAMEDDDRYAYSVAWLGCLARGRALGRSVLTRGRFAGLEELDARGRRFQCAVVPPGALSAGP